MTATNTDAAVARHNGSPRALTQHAGTPQNLAEMWQLANDLASSPLVPDHLRGQPASVFLMVNKAMSTGRDILDVMASYSVIKGKLFKSSEARIAEANASGRFKGVLKYRVEGEGDALTVTCWAVERETDEVLEFQTSMATAKKSGWTRNTKYAEDPVRMLMFRAATGFTRFYSPENALGVPTEEEVYDITATTRAVELEDDSDPVARLIAEREAEEVAPAGDHIPQPEYAPEVAVAKLVAKFGSIGVRDTVLVAEFGRLDRLTRETFNQAQAHGKRIVAGEDAADVFESEAALALLAAGAEPDAEIEPRTLADEAPF